LLLKRSFFSRIDNQIYLSEAINEGINISEIHY